MILSDFNLTITQGGFAHCGPEWNRRARRGDWRIYLPYSGSGFVGEEGLESELRPGCIYLINGGRGTRFINRKCAKFLAMHWLHFIVDSPYLDYLATDLPTVSVWECAKAGITDIHLKAFDGVLGPSSSFTTSFSLNLDAAPGALCIVHGVVSTLVGAALESAGVVREDNSNVVRLQGALDFMQKNCLSNPSLARAAKEVGMAANSFHRLFRQTFRITPFEYIQRQRMNRARHLLRDSSMSIKEVAASVGFSSPFYFSRVFHARFHMTPKDYRRGPTP